MEKELALIGDFQRKMKLGGAVSPTAISTKQLIDRHHLLTEELSEYLQAGDSGNLELMLDALVDLQYLLLGTVRLHGFQNIFSKAFYEVHLANMRKEPGVNSKRHLLSSDVLKPSDWRPADLGSLLK